MNGHDGRKGGMTVAEAIKIAKLLETAGCSGIEVSCGVMEDNFYSTRFKVHPAKAILYFDFKFEKIPWPVKKWFRPLLQGLIRSREPLHLFNLAAARKIKKSISLPVMAVGGVRNMDDIHEVIDDGGVDLVSLCKPLLLEPDLIAKFINGKQEKAKCIDCCYCMMGAEKNQRVVIMGNFQ